MDNDKSESTENELCKSASNDKLVKLWKEQLSLIFSYGTVPQDGIIFSSKDLLSFIENNRRGEALEKSTKVKAHHHCSYISFCCR
jgi:hypothetical protein